MESSNTRYKQLSSSSIFIAGDEEQFQSRRDYTNFSPKYDEKLVNEQLSFSKKYSNLFGEDLTNTFRYLFHKFKKGIYIRIKHNKLTHFLPFSKIKYINEWGDRIKYDITIFRKVCEDLGYKFNDRTVNGVVNTWYANNCLVRYEYPICENDTDLENYRDLFTEVCKNEKIPDIEFFINRRDFPMLKHTNTEPYNHIWDSEEKELVSHSYERYIPILSSSSIPSKFADILFPTSEDWARVRKDDGVVFPKYEKTPSFSEEFEDDFDSKIPTAVFRGSSTGIGVTIETNQRLKVAHLSYMFNKTNDGIPLLDAGITKWKNRPRKLEGEKELKTIDISVLPLVKALTPKEQSRYKYIIHINGYVSAYRLSYELNMGSVLLIVEGRDDYKLWFSNQLMPYVHFIPVKSDLSNLVQQIEWCRQNDVKMKEIIVNCKKFYKETLSKNGIYKYISSLFHSLKKHTGTYTYNSYHEKQFLYEKKFINSIFPKTLSITGKVINRERSYDYFRKIQNTDFISSLVFVKVLEKTKNTDISVFSIEDFDVVVKSSPKTDMIHEQFIGLCVVNPLLKLVPNFLFTFGQTTQQNLVIEKIKGINFMTWLDTKFNYNQFIHILSQLYLALTVAQRRCLFVHYDLFPWNVMIQELDEEIDVKYCIDIEKIVVVKTKLVPIIIDYGRSSAIVEHSGKHIIHSVNSTFQFNKHHDMRTIVISSIKHILNSRKIKLTTFVTEQFIFLTNVYNFKVSNYSELKQVCSEFSFSMSLLPFDSKGIDNKLDFISQFKTVSSLQISPQPSTLVCFEDEILYNYFSIFRYGGIVSTTQKLLPEFKNKNVLTFDSEMLHNKEKCKCFFASLQKQYNANIDYIDMLETIINYGDDETRCYFKQKYKDFLSCDRLILLNHTSIYNTLELYK